MQLSSILASYNAYTKSNWKLSHQDGYVPVVTLPDKIDPDQCSVLNDLINFANAPANGTFNQDQAQIDSVRQSWGLTDRDSVQVFVVPPNVLRRMPITSFVTRPATSPRLQKLALNITSSMSRMHQLEMGTCDPTLTDEERDRMIAGIQGSLARYQRAHANERARLSNAPRTGVIVVARAGEE